MTDGDVTIKQIEETAKRAGATIEYSPLHHTGGVLSVFLDSVLVFSLTEATPNNLRGVILRLLNALARELEAEAVARAAALPWTSHAVNVGDAIIEDADGAVVASDLSIEAARHIVRVANRST